MKCDDTKKLVYAYLDMELDAANSLAFEQHVNSCIGCRKLLDEEKLLKRQLQDALPYYQAPEGMEDKVLGNLFGNNNQTSDERPDKTVSNGLLNTFMFKRNNLFSNTLALISVVMVVIFSSIYYQHNRVEEQIISEVLGGHMRSLSASFKADIKSSDTDAIASWLKGRLDYAVIVPSLEKLDYQLQGAKLEYIQKQKVASLIYSKNNKKLNLFIWPSLDQADADEEMHIAQGYRIVYWCKEYMNYWVVSDLDQSKLMQVSKALR